MHIEFNKTWTETSLWPKEDIQSKILEKKIPIFLYFDHKLDLVFLVKVFGESFWLKFFET